ncbi:hypothetical protein Tco_0425566 [Tanacetum coccineum]
MTTLIVSRIYDDTDFKDKFGKIVWNMFIGPEEFEDRWNKLMEEFNLVNHKWLSKMSESENSFFSYFTGSSSTLVKFMLCYESAMESSDEGCTVCIIDEEKIKPVGLPEVIDKESTSENVEEEINLHQKVTGHYKLAMEASIILDSCVHMLRNNEPKLSVFVNKMKAIKSDLEAELPIVPTRIVSDFVQEFMGVKKPDKVKVKNPTGVRLKGREKQKRIKSGREISLKKSMRKTNKKRMVVVIHVDVGSERVLRAVSWRGGSDHVEGGLQGGASGSVSI